MAAVNEVFDFLVAAKTWYLATVDEDGNPCVRPFGAQNVFEDKLYIQTGLKKDVAKQLLANGAFEICGMAHGKWIRVNGTLVHDPRSEAQAAMLDANPGLKKMYAVDDGNTAVFYIKDGTATIYSFTEEPKVLEL